MRKSVIRKWIVLLALVPTLAETSALGAAGRANPYVERRDLVRAKSWGRTLLYSGTADQAVDKNFFYLTGLAEPGLALLLTAGAGRDVLLAEPPWDAERLGRLTGVSGIGRVFPMAGLDVLWHFYQAPSNALFILWPLPIDDPRRMFYQAVFDKNPLLVSESLTPILTELRMIKSADEIAFIQEAVDITAIGLGSAMLRAAPGMYERDLQTIIETAFRALGAARPSFPSIIGSGPNALILHWSENSRLVQPGDLIVMDVGAEFREYAGDLTRTVPASGFFSARQRQLYNLVLEALNLAVQACRPGLTLSELDAVARNYLTAQGYGKYFIHGLSHALGLDVHDAWLSNTRLAPGMVITLEPGLYLEGENIGIRIEDDVLITETGCVVLSAALPRKPEEIERIFTFR
jgi:Xaa-Pro aminopeptidase